MAVIPYDFADKRDQEMAEAVFETIHGFLEPEYQVSWAEDIFVPGHPCHEEYEKARNVCQRLQERLGSTCEDRDLVELMDHMAAYSKQLALEMFRCGMNYQKMLTQT